MLLSNIPPMKRPKLTLGIAHTSNMFILLAEEGSYIELPRLLTMKIHKPQFLLLLLYLFI